MKLSEGIYIKDRGLARKAPQGVFASIARKDNDEILCYVSKDIVDDEESILDIKILSREKSEKFRFWNNEKGSIYNYPYTPVFCRNGEYSVKISLEEASLNELRGCYIFYTKEFELKNIRNLAIFSNGLTPICGEKISLIGVTDSYIDLSVLSETKGFKNERTLIDELIFDNVQNIHFSTSRHFLNESKFKIRLGNVFCDTIGSTMFLININQEEYTLEDFKIEMVNVTFDGKIDVGECTIADRWFKELNIEANRVEIKDVTVTVRGEEYYNTIYSKNGFRVIGKDFTISELILGMQGKDGINVALRSFDCLFDDRFGNKKRHIRAEKIRDAGSCDMIIRGESKDIRVNANGHIRHKDDNSYGEILITKDFSLDVFSVMQIESDSVELGEFSSENSFININSSQKKLGKISLKNIDCADMSFGEKADGIISLSYEHFFNNKEPSTYRMVANGLIVSDDSYTAISFKDNGHKPVEADIQGLTLVGENEVNGDRVPARIKDSKLVDAEITITGNTFFEDCELMGKISTEFKNVVKRSTIVNSILSQCDSIEESYVRESCLVNVKTIHRGFIEGCELINVLCGDNVELSNIKVKDVEDLEAFDFSSKQPVLVANPNKVNELPSPNKNLDEELEL